MKASAAVVGLYGRGGLGFNMYALDHCVSGGDKGVYVEEEEHIILEITAAFDIPIPDDIDYSVLVELKRQIKTVSHENFELLTVPLEYRIAKTFRAAVADDDIKRVVKKKVKKKAKKIKKKGGSKRGKA